MTAILSIMLAVILTNNYVLAQFLGICPFLGVSKKLDSAVGMGVAVTFVMLLATAVTWPIADVRIKYFQHRLSADAGIHPGNRISGTAGRNDAEEIHASALQFAGCIPAADHD